MGFTPHSKSTPGQRQVANSNYWDKYNERKANELREQLDTKNKEVAPVHSLLHRGNKLFYRKEHRSRTITTSSYHNWEERPRPKAPDISEVPHAGCRTLIGGSKEHQYTHSFTTHGQETGEITSRLLAAMPETLSQQVNMTRLSGTSSPAPTTWWNWLDVNYAAMERQCTPLSRRLLTTSPKQYSAVDASKHHDKSDEDWEESLAMENTSGITILAKEWPNDGGDTFDGDYGTIVIINPGVRIRE